MDQADGYLGSTGDPTPYRNARAVAYIHEGFCIVQRKGMYAYSTASGEEDILLESV